MQKILTKAALGVAGLAAAGLGGAAIAGAASDGSGSRSAATTTTQQQQQRPNRPAETALTGETADKVRAAALDRVPGATVLRLETDAGGRAAYEAHLRKSDGTMVDVYVGANFAVVAVEERSGRRGPSGRHGHHHDRGPGSGETPLTGETADKVRAAALARVPGATVDRLETDADQGAKYEAHLTKSDGSHVTVLLDAGFKVTAVRER